jgi:hypothetical protein
VTGFIGCCGDGIVGPVGSSWKTGPVQRMFVIVCPYAPPEGGLPTSIQMGRINYACYS